MRPILQKVDNNINVWESQATFQRTMDAIALHNSSIVALGAPVRMDRDTGLADNLYQKRKWHKFRQPHQHRKQAEYMNQNHVPPMAVGWPYAPGLAHLPGTSRYDGAVVDVQCHKRGRKGG
jgi:hypothetical protein